MTLGTGTVQTVLALIANTLGLHGATTPDGAMKVGFSTLASSPMSLTQGSLRSAIAGLLQHINYHLQAVASPGGYRHTDVDINTGARTPANFSGANLGLQLNDISAKAAFLAVANQHFTGRTYFDSGIVANNSGDTSPAITTSGIPVVRKLLWAFPTGDGTKGVCIYSSNNVLGTSGLNGIEIAINAVWDGATHWTKSDNPPGTAPAALYILTSAGCRCLRRGVANSSSWLDVIDLMGGTGWDQPELWLNETTATLTTYGMLNLLGSLITYDKPRITTTRAPSSGAGAAQRTLLWEMDSDQNHKIRFYHSWWTTGFPVVDYERLEITVNAVWNNDAAPKVWQADNYTNYPKRASKFTLDTQGMTYQVRLGSPELTSWQDTDWTVVFNLNDVGQVNVGGGVAANGEVSTGGGDLKTSGGDVNTSVVLGIPGKVVTGGGAIQTGGGAIQTGGGAIQTGGGAIQTGGGAIQTAGGNIDLSVSPILPGGYLFTSSVDQVGPGYFNLRSACKAWCAIYFPGDPVHYAHPTIIDGYNFPPIGTTLSWDTSRAFLRVSFAQAWIGTPANILYDYSVVGMATECQQILYGEWYQPFPIVSGPAHNMVKSPGFFDLALIYPPAETAMDQAYYQGVVHLLVF